MTSDPPANPLTADGDAPFGRIDYILVRRADRGGPSVTVGDGKLIFD